MQNTLAEVELSAANESHIFGAGHATALEELRTAQLALAQAWAKSEADEVGSHAARDDAEEGKSRGAGAGVVVGKEKDAKNGGKQQQQQQQQQQSGAAGSNGKEKARRKTLEEETENDILLARTRREANDRYFEQVNNAVLDVVKKLDDVAGAMRKVERESRDIWGEDRDGSESVTGSTTGG
jgi:septum formation topological specificity factor MinE